MLTGRFPYGAGVAKCRTRAEQNKLKYASALASGKEIPAWVDGALKKAVHLNPEKRYEELSEFIYDLRHPNRAFLTNRPPPLIERNPLMFWKGLSLVLAVLLLVLLGTHPWLR
jgi:hypothetical protein